MKKSDKFEDSWDDKSLERDGGLKRNLALGIISAAILLGAYSYFSSEENTDDARMHYIRQDYDKSLKIIDSILNNHDKVEQHEQALEIKSEILSDKKSDYYDKHEAYTTLKELFSVRNSLDTARKLVDLGDALNKSEKEIFDYLEYLAKKKDIESISRVSKYFLSSEDHRQQLKARKFLEMLPETTEKLINLAKVELIIGKSNATIKNAETYLNSAVFLGSAEAMMDLAFLQLTKAEIDKFSAQKHKAQFPLMVKRAIDMGYRGEKLISAATIMKFGRYGVPQDMTLANLIEKIHSDAKSN
ncbi:hypothetical protein [Photobacterium galatheae]|uniref:Tetratricopeptide repeat-like domain-containing protein n=1 Tax=Photobacterium galatheae TaxID=1654360 RepID=A0A066RT55_9GAMM|nr:hypothetical protein [Photobacterium galatheae]KDM90877.1 hypothetical protein EA58_14045 [Photobacterium galatheae]MCM0149155.1 hypothetical protein [Photobacterium galatheae]